MRVVMKDKVVMIQRTMFPKVRNVNYAGTFPLQGVTYVLPIGPRILIGVSHPRSLYRSLPKLLFT